MAVETNDGLFGAIKEHLRLLGYSLTSAPVKKMPDLVIGNHSNRPKVGIRPYRNGVLLFALLSGTDQASEDRPGVMKFVNFANTHSTAARFYWNFSANALVAEVWIAGAYERAAFGAFFDEWTFDINACGTQSEAQKYLKSRL